MLNMIAKKLLFLDRMCNTCKLFYLSEHCVIVNCIYETKSHTWSDLAEEITVVFFLFISLLLWFMKLSYTILLPNDQFIQLNKFNCFTFLTLHLTLEAPHQLNKYEKDNWYGQKFL